MPALFNVAPPRLPTAPGQYESRFHDQHSDVLRLYFNQLSGNLNALTGVNGGAYIQSPHAMLMSDQDQPNAGITVANQLTFNQPVITQGIEVRNTDEIWFEQAGQYLVTFTLQVSNRGNAAQLFEVWAGYNGTNYPLSNTRFDIPARKSLSVWSHIVPAITGIFTVQQDEYLEIAWWGETTDVSLESFAANTSPTRPAIPSVILTVQFVAALPKKFYTIPPDRLSISGAAPTILRGAAPSPSASTLSIVGSAPTVTIA